MLRVEDLVKYFPIRSAGPARRVVGQVHAVDGVSFSLRTGETLGLVGESGCGKSTVGRTIIRLLEPTSGRIVLQDQDISHLSRKALRDVRKNIQMVFQDPYASLNRRMPVSDIIAEPLRIHGLYHEADKRVRDLIKLVGLSPEHGKRFPHELSGGQRQRVGIARALALNPKVLILDEPVSALDVSIQAQVIVLLDELQETLGLAYIFISHDLSVISQVADRVAVMYLGKIVEIGTEDQVYERPTHPYTQALLSAVPVPDPDQRGKRDRIVLEGDLPNPANPPSGCNFRTRCWKSDRRCADEEPRLVDHRHDHPSACHYASTEVARSPLDT